MRRVVPPRATMEHGSGPHGIPKVTRRRSTLGLAFVAFLCTGLPGAALGVVWPAMRASLGRPIGDLGIIFVLSTVGFATAALVHGQVVRAIGPGRGLAAGALLAAMGAAGFAAGWWPVVLGGAFLAGLGAGELESGLNGHVAVVHGSRAVNVLHGAFGVGAALGPLAATVLTRGDGPWQLLFVAVAVIDGALVLGFWLTRAAWTAVRPAPTADRPEAHPVATLGAQAGDRRSVRVLLGATLATFASYVALETAVAQWSFSYLTESRGVAEATAGLVVSGFWAALTLGRFAIGFGGARLTPALVLRTSVPLAVLAVLVIALAGGGGASVAVVLTGAALAGVFPALVASTPDRFGARTPAVMGWQLVAASVGLGAGPAIVAVAVASRGLDAAAVVFVVLSLLMAASALVVEGSDRGRSRPRGYDLPAPGRGATSEEATAWSTSTR